MSFLQEAFMQNALAAALISGALCAYLGVYVHLKRIIFIGIALSEVAALGVGRGCAAMVFGPISRSPPAR